ncbi:MAG: DUF1176 domain-containing protein [Ardenticatenaceae bacterium]
MNGLSQSLSQSIPIALLIVVGLLLAGCGTKAGGPPPPQEATQILLMNNPTDVPAENTIPASNNGSEAIPVAATEILLVATQAPVMATEAPLVATETPLVATEAPEATEIPLVATEAPEETEAPVLPTETSAPTRVQFAPGSISGSATGTLTAGQMDQYLLGAQGEQQMTVAFVTEPNGQALISIEGADGQVLAEKVLSGHVILPTTQDYMVSVIGLSPTPYEYELLMTINPLPRAPSVQNVGYPERVEWLQFLNVPQECESEFQHIAEYYHLQNLSGITFYSVEPQKYVIEVLCTTFAYSFHSRLYLYNAQNQSAIPLLLQDVAPDQTLHTTDILFTSSFGHDPNTNHFTNFQKGRGLGDCGAFYTYHFESDTLTLLEARYRECDDATSEYVPPTEWELVYP